MEPGSANLYIAQRLLCGLFKVAAGAASLKNPHVHGRDERASVILDRRLDQAERKRLKPRKNANV